MKQASMDSRWLLLPVIGVIAAGVFLISGGLTSAQTPEPTATTAATTAAPSSEGSYDDMLAEELGISVDELRAAQSTARDRFIDAQVTAGNLTAEQATNLKATSSDEVFGEVLGLNGIPDYLASVLSSTVGIDAEALRQGLEEGKSLGEIAEEQGIDPQEARSDLEATADDLLSLAQGAGFLEEQEANDIRAVLQDFIDTLFGTEDATTPEMTPTP